MCVKLGFPGFNEKSVGNIKNLYSVVDFFRLSSYSQRVNICRYYLAMLLGNRYQKNPIIGYFSKVLVVLCVNGRSNCSPGNAVRTSRHNKATD